MLSDNDRALIHDVNVTDGVRFAPPSGFIRTRVLTYSVAQAGPFTVVMDWADYTAEKIAAIYAKEIATLRAAGVKLAAA